MNRPFLEKSGIIPGITATMLLLLLLVPFVHSQDTTEPTADEKARQRLLKQEATNALWRLERSLEKDAFYSARIALNVWRSAAIDAGTFDQAKYDEFKKQLYEKSINDSMHCFNEFLLQDNFYDADICLETWRMHAKELGTFDQENYENLKNRLRDTRAKKATEEKEKEEIEAKDPDS